VINLDDFKMLIEEPREALESFKYRILEFNSKCDQRGYLAGSTEQPLLKINKFESTHISRTTILFETVFSSFVGS